MIRVTLAISGTMREYFDQEGYPMELPEGATLGDFLVRIGQDHEARLSGPIWNRVEHRFRARWCSWSGPRPSRTGPRPCATGRR